MLIPIYSVLYCILTGIILTDHRKMTLAIAFNTNFLPGWKYENRFYI